MVLELTEASLDVIGMDDDVEERVCDAEVVNARVEPLFDIAAGAVKLGGLST